MIGNGKPSILVVDDEQEILHSLFGLLRMEFDVHTADSGKDALDVMRRHTISVVMADQRMPEMTGVELLSLLQDEWPDTIRMVFTGYSDVKAVIESINESHIFRYITKPWDPAELRAVLRQACDEYEQTRARHRLLADLREHEAQILSLMEGFRSGQYGTLTPEGQAEVERLSEAAASFRRRLDTVEPAAGKQ